MQSRLGETTGGAALGAGGMDFTSTSLSGTQNAMGNKDEMLRYGPVAAT
jgi:hypothetical protein